MFDPNRPDQPNSAIMIILLQAFFDHLQQQFPFLNYDETVRQFLGQSLPPLISNCIASLAVP